MRPAIITTTVAVVGLIPAAIATGIGSQSQRPFAIVIVGGLVPGILTALLVLPVLYSMFNKPGKEKPSATNEPLLEAIGQVKSTGQPIKANALREHNEHSDEQIAQ